MLEKYLKVHKLSQQQLADKIGITRQGLNVILHNRSDKIKLTTVIKIKQATGLDVWQYCDGLEDLRKLLERR